MSTKQIRETLDKIKNSNLSEAAEGDIGDILFVVYLPVGWTESAIDIGGATDRGQGDFQQGAVRKPGGGWTTELSEAAFFKNQQSAQAQTTKFNNWLAHRAERRGDEPQGYAEVRRVSVELI